jgi:hypothetical protein
MSGLTLALTPLLIGLAGQAPFSYCAWSFGGKPVIVSKKTLIYTSRDCGHPNTREELARTMACEDTRVAFAKQARRLSPRLSSRGITVVSCPAGAAIAFSSDAKAKTLVLGDNPDFLGTVLIAPERRPLNRAGVLTDADLLGLIDEYLK